MKKEGREDGNATNGGSKNRSHYGLVEKRWREFFGRGEETSCEQKDSSRKGDFVPMIFRGIISKNKAEAGGQEGPLLGDARPRE